MRSAWAAASGVGGETGNQPSPMRAARLSWGSALPPNHTGMGRRGRGSMPALDTVWNSPWKSTTGSLQSRRISATCSS